MLKISALAVAASLLLAGLPLPAAAQVKVKVTSTGDVGQYAGIAEPRLLAAPTFSKELFK